MGKLAGQPGLFRQEPSGRVRSFLVALPYSKWPSYEYQSTRSRWSMTTVDVSERTAGSIRPDGLSTMPRRISWRCTAVQWQAIASFLKLLSSKHLHFHRLFCTRTTLKGKGVQKKHISIKYNNTYASPQIFGISYHREGILASTSSRSGIISRRITGLISGLLTHSSSKAWQESCPRIFTSENNPGQAIHKVLRALMLRPGKLFPGARPSLRKLIWVSDSIYLGFLFSSLANQYARIYCIKKQKVQRSCWIMNYHPH